MLSARTKRLATATAGLAAAGCVTLGTSASSALAATPTVETVTSTSIKVMGGGCKNIFPNGWKVNPCLTPRQTQQLGKVGQDLSCMGSIAITKSANCLVYRFGGGTGDLEKAINQLGPQPIPA